MKIKIQLFIAGNSPNSILAKQNLSKVLEEKNLLHHHAEVIDVYQNPQLALESEVFLTPMLILTRDGEIRRVVGSLVDKSIVFQNFDLMARKNE